MDLNLPHRSRGRVGVGWPGRMKVSGSICTVVPKTAELEVRLPGLEF